MGDGLNQRRCLTQEQIFDVNNKKLSFPWTQKGSHFEDKRKVEHSSGQPFLDPSREFGQDACIEHVNQFESSENNRKSKLGSKVCNDGELVKHMSNLPGFLQQVEKQKSIQEKALNFGVLDWRRLENWKYNERMPAKCHRKTSSSNAGSVCMPSGPPKMGPSLRKQPSSHGLNPSLLSPGKQPMSHSSCLSSPQRKPPPLQSYSSHLNLSKMERKEIDFKEENDFRGVKESKKKETHKRELQATRSSTTERPQNYHQKVESCDRSCSEKHVKNIKRKDMKKETVSERKTSSLELGKLKVSVSLNDTISGQGKENGKNLDDAVQYTSEYIPVKPQNVLLVPKSFPKRSCSKSSQFMESSTSLNMQLAEAIGNTFSDVIPPQKSREFSVDIPHSRFIPAGARVHAERYMEPHNFVTSQAIDLDNCRSACPEVKFVISMPSEGKCSSATEKATVPLFSVEAPKRSGVDIAVQTTVQGRHPTPTQRFGFGLGKMGRSSSFKESAAVPQLSSTYTAVKSGQVTEISSGMNNFDKDKANASSKGRSSPLRRLLDPLLKHRGSQSTEIVRPPSGTVHSMAFRTPATKGPSQDRKQEGLSCRGFLQLTLKNGLPFFKLVVDNSSSDMLVAVVKRLPLFGKSDHSMICEFYSVHEIRKKSMAWIQGSKNKRCDLGYNILGQMKISSFYISKLHSEDSSQCVVRECVLYGVDREQVDEQVLDILPDKEIAAVVLKYSRQKLNDGALCDDKRPYQERGFPQCGSGATYDAGGEENCNSTVVILPGGVHGIPSKGAPSSLISRWRSGGSCDCGGWDDGCKLRVLTNNNKNGKISQASMSSSAIDHVNLFVQGGERKSRPVFNLEASCNGFYSIEFDPSSICLLEAFATSVAFITSQKLSKILDRNSPEHNLEAIIGTDKMKTPTTTTFQRQVSAKYVTCPPSSPAGRI